MQRGANMCANQWGSHCIWVAANTTHLQAHTSCCCTTKDAGCNNRHTHMHTHAHTHTYTNKLSMPKMTTYYHIVSSTIVWEAHTHTHTHTHAHTHTQACAHLLLHFAINAVYTHTFKLVRTFFCILRSLQSAST